MHSKGRPATPQLKAWLDHYRPPPNPPTERYAALLARVAARKNSAKKAGPCAQDLPERKPEFHERKFAALVARVAARKQRVDNLVVLRARAIKSSERVWPPPPCHRRHKENIRHRELKREEEEARRAAEVARERAAREERVAVLMRLREAGAGRRPMNVPTLPTDIWRRIAKLCPLSTQLEIVQLNSYLWFHVVALVYRDVFVGARAMKFVHTLANNPKLPGLVKTLGFEESPETAVNATEWALVLPAMRSLGWLMVCSTVPCPCHVIPSITFRLWAFGSYSSVVGSWVDLIASQSGLTELLLWSDYYGSTPGVDKLPMLRSMRGRPADVARFANVHALDDIWFFIPPFGRGRSLKGPDLDLFAASKTRLVTVRMRPSQFMVLFRAAPQVLTSLCHIVLEEELAWSDFTENPDALLDGSALALMFAALDDRFPTLRSVCLAFYSFAFNCTRTRRLLNRADGAYFARLLAPLHRAPVLNALRIFAADGCASYEDWGAKNQVVSYRDRKTLELNHLSPLQLVRGSKSRNPFGQPSTRVQTSHQASGNVEPASARIMASSPNFIPGSASSEPPAICSRCAQSNPAYRCQDCQDVLCRVCAVRTDAHLSHQSECRIADSNSFQRVFAWQLGLRLRLLHGPEAPCPNCVVHTGFRVFSVSGMVELDVEFCGCHQAPSRSLQLLAARHSSYLLYGASQFKPAFSMTPIAPPKPKKKRRSLAARPPTPRAPEPPRVRKRRSVPSPQEIAKEEDAYFNPVAEAQWQSAMAELPAAVLHWAESHSKEESSDDDGSSHSSLAAPEADGSETLDAALQRRIAIDPRYQMEDIPGTEMAREQEERLRRRRWAAEEMRRRVRAERDARESGWESAVATAVAGMREPERRSWLDEQARQDGRYGAPWQVRMQQARLREMGPGVRRDWGELHEDWWGSRAPSEGASGSWVDYSTVSARYVESTRRQAGWTEELERGQIFVRRVLESRHIVVPAHIVVKVFGDRALGYSWTPGTFQPKIGVQAAKEEENRSSKSSKRHKDEWVMADKKAEESCGVEIQLNEYKIRPKSDTQRTVGSVAGPVRVFAPLSWRLEQYQNDIVWSVKGSNTEQDGIHINL
ncbi:hypothetical protein C8R47DRAFT_1064741 [Mycena vitilis]|nr:hypothetical protein C8R47DRAFT_1064741 [Mycena vitilis]